MFRYSFALLLAAASLSFAGTAAAQSCTGDAADNLLACSHISMVQCREAQSCENDVKQAVSAQDIIDAAAAKCCPLSRRAELRCLNTYAAQLRRARLQAPRSLRDFLIEARANVLALREFCDAGSLGDL
jgi:hypothetical protein